jgi:hypothetical protein
VDVRIEAKGGTEEIAQKILDNIYIEDSKSGLKYLLKPRCVIRTRTGITTMRKNTRKWE